MKIEDIVKYFKRHPEDIYKLCDEFNLHVDFNNKGELMKHYEHLKRLDEAIEEKYRKDPNKWASQYEEITEKRVEFEKLYHIYDPEFNMEKELRWIPLEYGPDAHEVFEYRKELFDTQYICQDMLLDQTIQGDMGQIWDEFDGEECGVAQAFPITKTYKSVVDVEDEENPAYNPESSYNNMKVIHRKVEMVRSYCLNSTGGIAIIETISHVSYDDKPEDHVYNRFQVLTLGEDDTYHFLNSARIYEEICGNDKDGFISMLNMAIKEFKDKQ